MGDLLKSKFERRLISRQIYKITLRIEAQIRQKKRSNIEHLSGLLSVVYLVNRGNDKKCSLSTI